ncbi:MAG TPA: iron-containing alcohol dehydrogenase [Terriglobia bacterium]|jgi:alcohol dehydrogenase class IV
MAFTLRVPQEVHFGKGEVCKLPEIVARFGRRAFVVTGARPAPVALGDSVRWVVHGEPEIATADEGAKICRESGCDVVVAIGGGSVLDTAKAAAALAANGGEALDYLEGVGRGRVLERPSLPFIAVPTTAGSGSEATRNAVLRVPDLKVKRSLRSEYMVPRVALIDPQLSESCPLPVAASAGLDALTHLIEAYVSIGAQPTTDALALQGIVLAAKGLTGLSRGNPDVEAMTLASFWGGIVLANAGLGAVHGLVAPLGGRFSVPHGMGCACLLTATMRTNIQALRERLPDSPALARYDEITAALRDVPDLGRLRADLGVPSLAAFGLSQDQFSAVIAGSRAGSMNFNPITLTDAELERILKDSL